ncbi:hypothetical protein HK413_09875 [Mucilaginibacter sp. S1162]|uniref:Deacetylase sirtuin-type domain-containing protein n=1 Tax=Mucilaginibacter humi TaxID=2732510 RepID=A0ABX1W5U6_9SPHI|nr:hypothetical protein [Mucilaginibacter humi]
MVLSIRSPRLEIAELTPMLFKKSLELIALTGAGLSPKPNKTKDNSGVINDVMLKIFIVLW